MSDTVKQPVDAFANIDLKQFKGQTKQIVETQITEEQIKTIAEENNFQSRQPVTKKPKIYPKTFSLFEDECAIINNAIKYYLDDPNRSPSQPSGSDVVRAALHAFSERTPENQIELIKENRGRGRR